MESFDVVIVGAGVVGLACARALALTNARVLLLESHRDVGQETSSRNSEVIHAGLYYPKGSLKAQLCVSGKQQLYNYCQANNIAHSKIGKIIVASNEQQARRLTHIQQAAIANGVGDTKLLSSTQLLAAEPNVEAICGLYSPSTGIIDSHQYMQTLLRDFQLAGGTYVGMSKVIEIECCGGKFDVLVNSQGELVTISCANVINSAGLHATNLAKKIKPLPPQLVPKSYLCKGSYFSYQGKSPFNHLIYPLPSELGLGIHATIDIGGQVKFGPDTEIVQQTDGVTEGCLDYGVNEANKAKFITAIKSYFPTISEDKLIPAYAGMRPKIKVAAGEQQDFIIQGEQQHGVKGLINLFGIESPGLTASLAIAETISSKI